MWTDAHGRTVTARAWFLVWMFAVASLAHAQTQAAHVVEEIMLTKGEQRVLTTENVRSYSEGVPGIVDVRLTRDGTQLVVVGMRAGETTLLLLLKAGGEVHYRILVSDPSTSSAEPAEDEAPLRVPPRPNIRLDFYFVELSQSYGHQLGVRWPASIGGGTFSASLDVLAGGFQSATAVIADQALPRLDLAQSEGWAKVMRRAAVITANGTEAKFAGGGEINIPLTGGFGGSLTQIRYGSVVGVLPRFDAETGRIDLVIHADVSDLTPDNGTGVPGRSVSTLDTVVNLELSQSLVLAGLTSRSESADRSGIPWLSQIPILGALFGSHRSAERDVETLIFIVPTVVETVDESTRAIIRSALAHYAQYRGEPESLRQMQRMTAAGAVP